MRSSRQERQIIALLDGILDSADWRPNLGPTWWPNWGRLSRGHATFALLKAKKELENHLKELPGAVAAVDKAAKDAGRTRTAMEEEVKKFRAMMEFEKALSREETIKKGITDANAKIKKYT